MPPERRDPSGARAPAAHGVETEATPRSVAYREPPALLNSQGRQRRIGLELEFAGLDVATALQTLADVLGGKTHLVSPAQGTLDHAELGKFRVELDSTIVQERPYARVLAEYGISLEEGALSRIEKTLLDVAQEVVPLEIVTPPLTWHELEQLDPLWAALRQRGAQGTEASPLYAFGMHINPEIPSLDVATTLAHLKAYFLLEPWLRSEGHTDWSRRMTPFIHPFSVAYAKQVVDPTYAPDFGRFIDDYLHYNKTRNRPLDLLPLLAVVDEGRVTGGVDDARLVNKRPTFHYRLPNCELGKPHWTPAEEWNRWTQVEHLARDTMALRTLGQAYLELGWTQSTAAVGVWPVAELGASEGWLELIKSWLAGNGWTDAAVFGAEQAGEKRD